MRPIDNLKKKFENRELIIGSHVGFDCIAFSELYGDVGFDFVWIDSEHSALDKKDVQSHLIAARAGGAAGFVRVPWNDPVLLKPILDMGADGVIIPMIGSYEDAVHAIQACKYPPDGVRGMGPRRANRYGIGNLKEYTDNWESHFWKILQIELVDVVPDLPRILELDGFDAIVIGPKDFACSMNKVAVDNDPEVEAYFDKIAEMVHASDKAFGVSSGYSEGFVKRWLARGVDFISLGFDYNYVLQGATNVLNSTKKFQTELIATKG